jgi:hypothetical protein
MSKELFKIYSDKGLIGYASSIKPFNIPGENALMLKGFRPIAGVVNSGSIEQPFVNRPLPQITNKRPITPGIMEQTIVRERLPNYNKKKDTITVVNGGKEETIKVSTESQDGIIKAKYFRCPDCGQSCILSIDGALVVRDIRYDQEVLLSGVNVKLNEDLPKSIETFLNEIGSEDLEVEIGADDSLEVFCHMCSNVNLLKKWILAWESPLDFFEFDNPCCMCGGETVESINRNKTRIRKCEKCDYEQILRDIEEEPSWKDIPKKIF